MLAFKNMNRGAFVSFAIVAALVTLPPACLAEDMLKIGGTGAALGLMKALGEAFHKSHPAIEVEVVPSLGSTGAIRAFQQGAIDVAISSRPFTEEERKPGFSYVEFARTPLVPVVGGKVGVSNLTTDDVLRIYQGELKAWPNGERIRVILRTASESDTGILKGLSAQMSLAVDQALSREGMQIAMTDQDNTRIIARTPGALGFCTLAQLITESAPLVILAFNGVTPSIKALSDGSYPLFKSFGFVIGPASPPLGAAFISFAISAEGKRILERSGCLFEGTD
jgi:phosphate transport system substrate-binding protein